MLQIALVTAALLGGGSFVAAQDSPFPPTASEEATRPPGAPFEETLVVTATLEPEPIERLSTAVDVVERAEIESRRSELVLDLLRTLPGLALTQSGSPGKVASLFVRGASSAQTLVLLDGVPLNDPVLGAFDWSAISTEGLERLEVVRGPYSALWGSGAMGGVVHLVTRRPGEPFAALRAEAGEREHRRGSGSASGRWGRLGLDGSGALWEGQGELANDDWRGDEARVRAEVALGERGRAGLLVRDGTSDSGLPYDFFGALSPRREQRSTSRLLALPVELAWDDWAAEATLARHETEVELADPDDPFAASTNEAEREHARAVVRRRFAPEAGSSGGGGSPSELWLAGGIERERQVASSSSAFGPGLDRARATVDGIFAQAGWARGRARLDLGVRRDEPSEFEGATSGKAGLVVALGDGARGRASWGQSFRAPALGDLYFPFFGNPELEPERGESLELGIELERRLGAAGATTLAATLGAFRNDFEELIVFDLVRGAPFNVGRARASGVEVAAELRRGGLRARIDATWLDAEDLDSGAPLPRRPERSANLLVAFSPARFDASAALRYVGAREDVGRVALDPYAVVDLALSWRPDPRLSPYLRIENALDRDYEEAAGFPAPGRRLVAGIALRTRP